ncbi:leucine-rich repeat domain-containing protein [Planctobacterium marinum]|uniref:Internalin n=1 Tax=Planctobacterium marinum TaxID=1631968 RepID=A0AA48I988_9ALTE|nr:hypothetical protein MACH26_38010 [Planctobacterium marinum]
MLLEFLSNRKKVNLKLTLKLCLFLALSSGVKAAGTELDFDGDGKADLTTRRAQSGEFFLKLSGQSRNSIIPFGESTDIPFSGDFDGDGIADLGLRRASNYTWYIVNSSGVDPIDGNADGITRYVFGRSFNDIPVPADYDGDGITDIAVRRPETQYWYIRNSSGIDGLTHYPDGITRQIFGRESSDIPVPADYDGDGKADIAVRRARSHYWYIQNSSEIDSVSGHTDGITRLRFGRSSTDIPVPADYDGDGKADIAVRRPHSYFWYIRNSSGIDTLTGNDDGISRYQFGKNSADIPVPADYDGDGKTDLAVRRLSENPNRNQWFILNSSGIDPFHGNADGISRMVFSRNEHDIPLAQSPGVLWFNADLDRDGLSNFEEYRLGTDFTALDTDGDGLSDGTEVNVYQTNPTEIDSDGDGVDDPLEIEGGSDPNDNSSTAVLVANLQMNDSALQQCIVNTEAVLVAEITELECREENITDISGIEHLTALLKLDLWSNSIADISPLAAMLQLENLHLSHNPITDLSYLSGLVNLNELSLVEISATDISALVNLTNLHSLNLNSNNFEDYSPIEELTQLRELYLRNNQLSDIAMLSSLSSLWQLNLQGNNITDISPLKGLQSLYLLNLIDNQISDISVMPEIKSLGHLYLDNSPVLDLSPVAEFGSEHRWDGLSLRGLQLTDINFLSQFEQILSLDVSDNNISDLSPLENLIYNYRLNLSNNQITDISKISLSSAPSLLYLYLAGNQITDVSYLSNLKELRILDLENNQVLDITALSDLTKVRRVNLNGNQVSELSPLGGLGSLTRLYLADNEIIDISMLFEMPQVLTLDLSGNDLISCSDLQSLADLISFEEFTQPQLCVSGR